MNIPNTSINLFYEGTNEALYSNLTGVTINSAPKQLLANDVALESAVNDLENSVNSVNGVPLAQNSTKIIGLDVWRGTQAEYDAIVAKDDNTLYFVQ